MFAIDPIQDILLVEQDVEKTRSGIVIPETVEAHKIRRGTVVAIGPGKFVDGVFVPTTLKVGDHIAFGKYQTGEPYEWERKMYLVMREGDVVGKLREETTLKAVA